MSQISGSWVTDPQTQSVMAVLQGAGYRALFVGGCVRDALLGRPVADIDIATDALPEMVVKLADAAGFKPVPTGIDHGTITVVTRDRGFEVTTFRRDVETDGRRAVVAYSRDLADDARRRDLTINALYSEADGTVIDPLGTGLSDLAKGIVRFIDEADARIQEDYLRILRFFRFYAWYGKTDQGPDPDALSAISDNLDGLASVSLERITHEMLRLLAAPDPTPALAAMTATGVLARVLPGADPSGLGPLVNVEQTYSIAPDPIRRLSALGCPDVALRLRLSRRDERALAVLRAGIETLDRPQALGYKLGAQHGLDVVLLRSALAGTELLKRDLELVMRGSEAKMPISAADLMPAYRGGALGRKLAELEARWIASEFTLSREALLKD